MKECPGTHLSLEMGYLTYRTLKHPANFKKFEKFKVRLKLIFETEYYLNSNVSNSLRKFKFDIDTIIKYIIISTYLFFCTLNCVPRTLIIKIGYIFYLKLKRTYELNSLKVESSKC